MGLPVSGTWPWGTERSRLEGHEGVVEGVAFRGDGKLAVTGSWDGTVRLWDLPTGSERLCLRGHKGAVRAIALSRDGNRILSGSWDRTAQLWDAATGQTLAQFG